MTEGLPRQLADQQVDAGDAAPLVTVLIPAYNAAPTIERALRSVVAQDYAPIEIVVVDDGSKDETAAIVEAMGIPGLRLLRLPENHGACGAANAGLAAARGKYIAFLDADDEWLPGKLRKQVPLLERSPNMIFATCGCLFVDNAGIPMREFGLHPPDGPADEVWRALLRASRVAKPCVVARASVIKASGGFNPILRVAEDQDMWIRLASQGEVGFIEEILVIVHDTPGSLTKVHAQRIADFVVPMVEQNIERLRDRLTEDEIRQILGERYTLIGRNLYSSGYTALGLKYLALGIGKGNRVSENLWYVATASPPARFIKSRVLPPPANPRTIPKRRSGNWTSASLLNPVADQLAAFPDGPPILSVVIDTEAEFDWSKPLNRDMTNITNIKHQHRAHTLFQGYGVKPTYAVAYAVAVQDAAIRPLTEFLQDKSCSIGAHLQPWENPPFDESLGQRNSFVGNLPFALQRAKLELLTRAIEENFHLRPIVYKAGRYGVSEDTSSLLDSCGYEVDVSVLPARDLRSTDGPDFSEAFNKPYWFGPSRRLFEVPMTVGLVGALSTIGNRLYHTIDQERFHSIHVPGVFARLGLLERITLTPEGVSLDEMRRLTRKMIAQGHRIFTLTYHSPSLAPGNTPYVRDDIDLHRFITRIEGYLDFFFRELGGVAMDVVEVRDLARRAAEHDAPQIGR